MLSLRIGASWLDGDLSGWHLFWVAPALQEWSGVYWKAPANGAFFLYAAAMDRTAVFVDAGYLFAAGSRLLANQNLARRELNLDYDAVLKLFEDLARDMTGLPLLRVYWYDGTATGPTPQQLALAYRPSVKLRLGFVNRQGEQKGVDSLIVTDLINLARNRAMADALLLTGDEDIRVGVQQAQEFGVRVHLLGIAPSRDNQSGFLAQEADSLRELVADEVRSFLTVAPPVPVAPMVPVQPVSPVATTADLVAVAERLVAELNTEEVEALLQESVGGSVPAQIDRRLLVACSAVVGGSLNSEQKRAARGAFLETCRKRTRN